MELLNLDDYYALTFFKASMLKHEIKNILIKFLVDEEILDPSALSPVLITQTDLQLRELEIQRQIQLENLRLEQEEKIRVEQLEREERMQKKNSNGERKIRNGRKREGERKTNSEREVRNGRTI